MQRPAKPFTPVRFRLQPPHIMKTGIIGFGFVGRALRNGLKDNVECIEIDPKLGTNLSDLKSHEPDVVFICLPTPMNDDGTQNINLVKNIIINQSALVRIVLKNDFIIINFS